MCSEYPTGLPKRNSHSRFPDHQWIIARIVEDGICFSLVKNKMQKWRDRGRQLREQSKAELLCAVMMEAAAEKSAQDSGTGFLVGRHEMSQALSIDETAFRNLFRNVKWRIPCEFEDLQRFALLRIFNVSSGSPRQYYPARSPQLGELQFVDEVHSRISIEHSGSLIATSLCATTSPHFGRYAELPNLYVELVEIWVCCEAGPRSGDITNFAAIFGSEIWVKECVTL
jgi:hypothetical protein